MELGQGHAHVAEAPGALNSSTRAEITGGLLGLAARAARTNICTDSKGFRSMHRKVCAARAGYKMRPFCQSKNGDLALMWADAVRRRGAHAITVWWAKGHTETAEQRAAWGITLDTAVANGWADAAEDQAYYRFDLDMRLFGH